MKYSFLSDYSEGCHPAILEALSLTNKVQTSGYGEDSFCEDARNLLRQKMQKIDADIHFVSGGTQANLLCIANMLKPFEAVIAPSTGHIFVNEAGAIEATGHKIISVPAENGKITPAAISAVIKLHVAPHTVRAKVVYVTNATEIGTIYSKAELTAIHQCCREHNLYLFLDGARLGVALASNYNDLTLADIAEFCDMFYLGGTKMGALFGEAIIITNDELKPDFSYHLKQRGALLAKGRVLGLQFQSLLTDDLYVSISAHANKMAEKLSKGLSDADYELAAKTESNQVFVALAPSVVDRLSKSFAFSEWSKCEGGKIIVRLVTSWATDETQVNAFVAAL